MYKFLGFITVMSLAYYYVFTNLYMKKPEEKESNMVFKRQEMIANMQGTVPYKNNKNISSNTNSNRQQDDNSTNNALLGAVNKSFSDKGGTPDTVKEYIDSHVNMLKNFDISNLLNFQNGEDKNK